MVLSRVIALMIMLMPVWVWATTPTVTNVTGTITTGQTLTITGTYMMDENKTNWLSDLQSGSHYGFESATLSKSGEGPYNATGGALGNSSCTISSTTSVKLSGSRSMLLQNGGVCAVGATSCQECDLYFDGASFSPNSSYLRAYVRFNMTTWPTHYMKLMETVPASDPVGDWYSQPDMNSGDGPVRWLLRTGDDPTGHYFDIPSAVGQLQNNRWYYVEIWQNHTGNTISGWIDGQSIGVADATETDTVDWILFGTPNFAGTSSGFTYSQYWDNVVLSTSRIYPSSTIEISGDGGSTWKWQPPTSLSDTTITVTADLPTLSAASYLLRVTNNKQETSSTYNLSGGSTPVQSVTGCSIVGGTIR